MDDRWSTMNDRARDGCGIAVLAGLLLLPAAATHAGVVAPTGNPQLCPAPSGGGAVPVAPPPPVTPLIVLPKPGSEFVPLLPGDKYGLTVNDNGIQNAVSSDIVLPGTYAVNGLQTKAVRSMNGDTVYTTSDGNGVRIHRIESFDADFNGTVRITFSPPMPRLASMVYPGSMSAAGVATVDFPGFGTYQFGYNNVETLVAGPYRDNEFSETVRPWLRDRSFIQVNSTLTLYGTIEGESFQETETETYVYGHKLGIYRESESNSFYTAVMTNPRLGLGNDFDGNRRSDVAWTDSTSGNVALWRMNATNEPVVQTGGTLGATQQVVARGDFDGDQTSDLLLYNTQSCALTVRYFDTLNSPVDQVAMATHPTQERLVAVGEFSGDGQHDLLFRNTVDGALYLRRMAGANVLGYVPLRLANGPSVPVPVPLFVEVAGIGDFNGDGIDDILWRNPQLGTVAIWLLGNETIIARAAVPRTVPSGIALSRVADFDGDGRSDVLWRNTTTGLPALWLMNGTAVRQSQALSAVPTEWQIADAGDFDADGDADIFWTHQTNGKAVVWTMQGTTLVSGRILNTLSGATQRVVP